MDSDNDTPIKRMKIMNPYVMLNKAFVINSSPSIVKQFNNEQTSDVKVILGDDSNAESSKLNTIIYLHKLVLSSGSAMFDTWLKNYSDQSKDAVLRIPEGFPLMHDFFKYFYTGQITMDSENLVDIYMVADKYLVESLKSHCEDYIKESLKITIEKINCPHMTSVLVKPSCSSVINSENCLAPSSSNLSLRNRTLNGENVLGSNIFYRLNPNIKSLNNKNFNAVQIQSSNIFNTNNATNIFAKKNFESFDLISECASLNSMMDSFCAVCNPGPVSVTRILAFSTVVNLAQTTCNEELAQLAKYHLMIRLTEELRSDDYSQFVLLPYDLLHDLLEDDNFYCSEFHLFSGLQHWIQTNRVGNAHKPAADPVKSECAAENAVLENDSLLALIRLPVLSVDELYEVEISAKSSGHYSDSALFQCLNKAMRYIVYRTVQKAKLEDNWAGVPCKPRIPVDIFKLALPSLS